MSSWSGLRVPPLVPDVYMPTNPLDKYEMPTQFPFYCLMLDQNQITNLAMGVSKPVIVLIPGSFHPPAVWTKVAGNLRTRGYEVLTPALVSTGAPADPSVLASLTCEDDAAAILKEMTPVLDEGKEAVVLGHSYGSIVAAIVCRDNTVKERAARGLKGGIRGLVSLGGYAFPVRGKNVFGTDGPAPDISWNIVKVEAQPAPYETSHH